MARLRYAERCNRFVAPRSGESDHILLGASRGAKEGDLPGLSAARIPAVELSLELPVAV